MPERSLQDLGHHSQTAVDIGRLQCLARFPVIAGDSFEFNSQFLFRLNQLRRPLTVDLKTEIFVFYCPYRYTYGQDFISAIEDGPVSSWTFPTKTTTTPPFFLQVGTSVFPQHLWYDTISIWNNYFRDPSDSEWNPASTTFTKDSLDYGLVIYQMKDWGTAQSRRANPDASDYQVAVQSGHVNFYDIQAASSVGRNRSFRDFIGSRYKEIVSSLAGTELHDYADNVPELVWTESSWMSGYDVNGTAGADLGVSVGKGVGTLNLNMPRRLFSEHGTLYVFSAIRMPPVFESSRQYLDTARSYRHVIPVDDQTFEPVPLTMSDLFVGGSGATQVGYVPMYEWYRDHPSYIHPVFVDQDTGWQYQPRPTAIDNLVRCNPTNYDQMFQTMKLRHAVVTCQHNVKAWRPIPSQEQSLFGGQG